MTEILTGMDDIDDEICGSYKIGNTEFEDTVTSKKTLRDRILDYVNCTHKPTKGSIFINVSSSGTAGSIISALVSEGILVENKFDCGNCVYYVINKSKIHLI
jgi:hypothetical protein